MSTALHPGAAPRQLTVPSRAADLGFAVELPGDWQLHTLPDDHLNFEDSTRMLPLVVATAPQAAIVFSAAARPAYNDGTVSDWARFLLDHSALVPSTQGLGAVGDLQALVGECTQDSELGPMCVRFAFAEDGGRLLSLSLSAPQMLAQAMLPVWQQALSSFMLHSPKGPTVRVWPQAQPAGAECGEGGEGGEGGEERKESSPAIEALAVHALADDAASFDPQHPVLQNLRDRGIGLAPRVLRTDALARCVTLASGAIVGFIDAPFGWHAIDDGQRLLLLDPGNEVQLNFSLLQRPEGGLLAVLDGIETQAREDHAAPEFLRLELPGALALVVSQIAVSGEAATQLHLLQDGPSADLVLRCRITSTPERASASGNLGHAMLASVVFGNTAQA